VLEGILKAVLASLEADGAVYDAKVLKLAVATPDLNVSYYGSRNGFSDDWGEYEQHGVFAGHLSCEPLRQRARDLLAVQ
jgi:hypothetical protein